MRGARAVLVLGIVTLVAVGAVLFVERGSNTPEPGGGIVFPALLEQVNSVARVRVTGSEGTFTLARDGDAWVVEEKERHPADPDRVHKLLVGAAGMKRVEPKTSDPERYPRLWLEDPTGKDARSVRTRPGGRVGRRARGLGARRPPSLEVRRQPHRALHPRGRRPAGVARRGLGPRRRTRSSTGWTVSSPASTASACAPPRSPTRTVRWSR